ncbi:hypothetical protein SAMN05421505_1679 [Sinosporangium album]|uniref:Uncharacterized protein n=1 Tax=Sinosporangium album TaxID=504805 RepID=A0A1G8LFZ6_9ACTN|nr:hypothetical protein SAMN05421505_1679 [Sinosporangium album]
MHLLKAVDLRESLSPALDSQGEPAAAGGDIWVKGPREPKRRVTLRRALPITHPAICAYLNEPVQSLRPVPMPLAEKRQRSKPTGCAIEVSM